MDLLVGLPPVPEECAADGASLPTACKRRRASDGAAGSSSALAPAADSAGVSEHVLPHGLPRISDSAGVSVEHVHRGSHKDGEGAVPCALQEVLRNMQHVLAQRVDVECVQGYLASKRRDRPVKLFTLLQNVIPKRQGKKHHAARMDEVVATLTGMNLFTVQAVRRRLKSRQGKAAACKGAGGRPTHREPSGDDPEPEKEHSSSDGTCDLLEDVVLDEPRFAEPLVQAARPDLQPGHDVRQVGLRLGALVARVYIDPRLPISAFTPLVSFMDAQSPGCVGEVNHGDKFFSALGRCMVSHLQLCTALEHWATVPALGIPSDFARIIDGYTCEGEPCQVIVHIITRPSGDLEWLLVDVAPNAGAVSVGQDRSHSSGKVTHHAIGFAWSRSRPESGSCALGFL